MNRTKQIIIVGASCITLMFIIRCAGQRFVKPVEHVSAPFAYANSQQKWIRQTNSWTIIEDPKTNKDGAVYGTEIQTVRMDLETERYKKMKQAMTEALESLGIDPQERTVQRLVGARIRADWSEVPESFRNAPEWAALQSFKLKRAISLELKTKDPLTVQRVLETVLVKNSFDSQNLVELPPMADYELREGQNAVYNEAKAIEARK